jgi:hypothetical protein
MKWFAAWVTFSCVVVPAGSWVCACIREARGTQQPCLARTVAARGPQLPVVRTSDGRRFIGALAGLERSLIAERANAPWPAR